MSPGRRGRPASPGIGSRDGRACSVAIRSGGQAAQPPTMPPHRDDSGHPENSRSVAHHDAQHADAVPPRQSFDSDHVAGMVDHSTIRKLHEGSVSRPVRTNDRTWPLSLLGAGREHRYAARREPLGDVQAVRSEVLLGRKERGRLAGDRPRRPHEQVAEDEQDQRQAWTPAAIAAELFVTGHPCILAPGTAFHVPKIGPDRTPQGSPRLVGAQPMRVVPAAPRR